jgi:anti-sigma regulatory factor (Ser/Thr protein kinase)
MPSQPQPRASWAALHPIADTSARSARSATQLFLSNCQGIPDEFIETAKLLVSELVTNAYEAMSAEPATGIPFIELSLRLFGDRLLIEVIDSSPEVPVPKLDEDAEALDWRGLAVVHHMSEGNWGWFWRLPRKVVFCEMSLTIPTQHGKGETDG